MIITGLLSKLTRIQAFNLGLAVGVRVARTKNGGNLVIVRNDELIVSKEYLLATIQDSYLNPDVKEKLKTFIVKEADK